MAIVWDTIEQEFDWTEDLSAPTGGGGGSGGGTGGGGTTYAPSVQVRDNHFLDIKNGIDYAMAVSSCNVPNAWDGVSQADRDSIGLRGQPVLHRHANALRTAITNLYSAKGQAVPPAIQITSQEGNPIPTEHVEDMRNALNNLVQNHCAAAPAGCGNNVTESPETCDNGFSNGPCPAACSATCTTNSCPAAVCGNNATESPETCDNGFSNGPCPAACSATCTTNTCANVWYCGRNMDILGTGSESQWCTKTNPPAPFSNFYNVSPGYPWDSAFKIGSQWYKFTPCGNYVEDGFGGSSWTCGDPVAI